MGSPNRALLPGELSLNAKLVSALLAVLLVLGVVAVSVPTRGYAAQTTSLTVTQGTPTGTFALGQVLTYPITVTNPGDDRVTGVVVTDDQTSSISCPATTLEAGASMVCTANVTISAAHLLTGKLTNTATATGSVTRVACTPEPLTPVIKSTQTYTFPSRITGVVEVGWEITLALVDSSAREVGYYKIRLEATDTTVPTTQISGNLVNVIYRGLAAGSVGDLANINQVELSLASGGLISSGSLVYNERGTTLTGTAFNNFEQIMVNTAGNATTATLISETPSTRLTGIDVGQQFVLGQYYLNTDPSTLVGEAPAFQIRYAFTQVNAGEKALFDFNRTSATALQMENHAFDVTAVGCYSPAVSVTGTSTSTTDLWQPALTVDKIGPTGTLAVGQTVTYSFNIQNTGNVTLSPLVINDPLTSNETCPVNLLAPGATTDRKAPPGEGKYPAALGSRRVLDFTS